MKSDSAILDVVKPKILIAEPSFYLSGIYAKELKKLGYDTMICGTVDQAIHEYEKQAELISSQLARYPFFAVIVNEDIQPSGDSTIRKILSIEPSQKILYITKLRQILPPIKPTVIEFIEKPFSMNFLIRKLEKIQPSLYN